MVIPVRGLSAILLTLPMAARYMPCMPIGFHQHRHGAVTSAKA